MKRGGFDCRPVRQSAYERIQVMRGNAPESANFEGEIINLLPQVDSTSTSLLIGTRFTIPHAEGFFGYIWPEQYLSIAYGQETRQLLSEGRCQSPCKLRTFANFPQATLHLSLFLTGSRNGQWPSTK